MTFVIKNRDTSFTRSELASLIKQKIGSLESYRKQMGWSRFILRSRLNHKTSIKVSEIIKSAELLGVSLDQMIDLFEKPKSLSIH